MFETKKTLIVVYKDELLMNQLKKMVETHDDNEQGVVGTRDDSINIVSWTEKVWLENKKAGNIQGKILFLGEIKGTDAKSCRISRSSSSPRFRRKISVSISISTIFIMKTCARTGSA